MINFNYKNERAPIVTAIIIGNIEDFYQMIKNGADINQQDENGASALIAAICNDIGDMDLYKFMVEQKIDLNLKDKNGDTALDLAKFYENQDVVNCLNRYDAKGKEGSSSRAGLWDQIYSDFEDAKNKKLKND